MGNLLRNGTPYYAIFASIIWLISSPTAIFFTTALGHARPVEATQVTCDSVCEYDDWFERAHCEERNLDQVPLSTGCEAAKIIELQENLISHIDAATLSGYKHLKNLDVSRNQITRIDPDSFTNNIRLTNILISRNHIRNLYDDTFNGTEDHLTRIYLTRNEISNISDNALRGLGQLVTLYLSHNLIRYLPATLFHDLSLIEHLYLSENKLDQIAPDAFEGLTSLRTLTLDGNKLSRLPEGLFDDLLSIDEVILSNNVLIVLPPPESLGQIEYQILDLSENHFNTSSSIVPYLSISERLYIGGNPFNCDCDFLMIQRWYQNKSDAEREVYEFKTPIRCENYSIHDLLPLSCKKNISSRGVPIIYSTSTSSTSTSVTTHSVVSKVTDPSEREIVATSHETSSASEQDVNSNSEIYDLLTLEKKISGTLVYCAVIITIFFALWVAKQVYKLYSNCSSKRAEAKKSKRAEAKKNVESV